MSFFSSFLPSFRSGTSCLYIIIKACSLHVKLIISESWMKAKGVNISFMVWYVCVYCTSSSFDYVFALCFEEKVE